MIRDGLSVIRDFRERLWNLEHYGEGVQYLRNTSSAELSRKLEHIINPPKAMGMAEDVSLESIKWFAEYWWMASKDYSPDLYVASDNTVVASWWEERSLIQIRFFSSGYALASIRQAGKGEEGRSRFWMSARELPSSFVW